MKKKTIGALVIASAIIWGAVIIGCAFILKGTPYKEDVSLILIGGVISHMLFIWTPLGSHFRKKKEE